MPQPYVDGVTDTVTHNLANSLTAAQITPGQDTLTLSVVCPDRWFVGDLAVATRRDGRGFAGKAEAMDVCTGEVTISAAGRCARELPCYAASAGRFRTGTLSSRHKDHQPSRRTRPGGRTPPAAESDHGLRPGALGPA